MDVSEQLFKQALVVQTVVLAVSKQSGKTVVFWMFLDSCFEQLFHRGSLVVPGTGDVDTRSPGCPGTRYPIPGTRYRYRIVGAGRGGATTVLGTRYGTGYR